MWPLADASLLAARGASGQQRSRVPVTRVPCAVGTPCRASCPPEVRSIPSGWAQHWGDSACHPPALVLWRLLEALQGCCGKSLTLGSRQSPSLWGRVWGLTGGVCPLGARTLTALSASHSLHKVLFTEQPETYYKWDNWPPESDRK